MRPISLSNVMDRVVYKVMTNRLKLMLPDIFSESQSAFILNRLITNNVIIAYKLLHSLKKNMQGRKGFFFFKD